MEALLGIALIAWVLTRAISDAKLDHTYAKQGQVSPRLRAKYGDDAREKTFRYGMSDYFKDAWSDHWQRRSAALAADREVFLANPGPRVRFRDRLAAARRVMNTAARKLVEPVPSRTDAVVDVPPEPAPALAVDLGDVPVGTVRVTGDGDERWDGNEWNPVREPSVPPADAATRRFDGQPETDADRRFFDLRESGYTGWIDQDGYAVDGPTFSKTDVAMGGTMTASTRQTTCSCCQKPSWDADPAEYAPLCGLCLTRSNPSCVGCQHRGAADSQQAMRHTWSQPTATGTTINGGTMADIGLEASNYETAVPALDTLTAAARDLSEHVAGAKTAAAQFHDQVEEIDEARRAVEQAATSVAEQLSARNLDTATMSAITTSMEMVQTGDLAASMDHIDAAIRLLAGAEAAAAEASGASAEASRTVVSKYGDAHAQVVSELSGDPSFLGSGGGAGAAVGGSGPSGNIRAHAGAGETVNVSGDSVGRTNRGGAAPSGRPSPGGGDGGSSHNVGVVQSGGGRVTVGGDTAGVINKG